MKYPLTFLLSVALFACDNNTQTKPTKEEAAPIVIFQNKGHELVAAMAETVGTYKALRSKKDVVYTYTYTTTDGKTDISTEKYIFAGELSYGRYQQHQRTLADLPGVIEQGYDGTEFWLKQDGQVLRDSTLLKRVAFNRPTNFYWFAMFQKLLDSGLQYEYLGEQAIDGKTYDIVKVSFDSSYNKAQDIYQVYINQETKLVDQFLFTVADYGRMEKPLLMRVEYEAVDGILIPAKRQYKASTWEAEVSDAPWVKVVWSDIKFDNKLTPVDFKK